MWIVDCSFLHESCNLESNKLMLKLIIFDYSFENWLSFIKVIILQLFSRNQPKKRFLIDFYGSLLDHENYLKILTLPFDREFENQIAA
jgi:hypothetical protein